MTDDHRSSDPAASRDPVPIGAVLHGVPGGTAEEVLGAIARHLVGKGLVEESFPQALWDRERRYPTGLPTRIPTAIPHADTEHVRTRCLAVATLIQPVEFGEMGGAEGDTVVTQLLVLPLVTDPDAMVPALQRMIGALTDEQVVTELLGAADEAELMRLAQLHLSGTSVAGRSEAGPSGLATSYVDGLGASHATGTTPTSTVA
ncbi:PTS sugar transporter subunit IIA, partial [Brachybacterium muris]|uniref:PTS sugar transporter subunit IIA n=2 Tax=Brachybacterium muris TaxID=219301 RepID=UPI00223B1FD5